MMQSNHPAQPRHEGVSFNFLKVCPSVSGFSVKKFKKKKTKRKWKSRPSLFESGIVINPPN